MSTEGSENIALVFGDYNQYQQATIILLDQTCEKVGEIHLDEAVKDISLSHDRLAVLLQQEAIVYDMTGTEIRRSSVERSCIGIQLAGSSVYVSLAGRIEKA